MLRQSHENSAVQCCCESIFQNFDVPKVGKNDQNQDMSYKIGKIPWNLDSNLCTYGRQVT